MLNETQKAYFAAWRKANLEKVREAKRRYYQSEKGKAQKFKEEEAYKASGGRAKAEERRKELPISSARKAARVKWAKANPEYAAAQRSLRRSLERNLSELDRLVVEEAYNLAKIRRELLKSDWHVDHIIPVSKGGLAVANNLQVVPASWNRSKSNLHQHTFWS